MRIIASIVLLSLCMMAQERATPKDSVGAAPISDGDLEKQVKKELKGRILALRQASSLAELRFRPDGSSMDELTDAPWFAYSHVKVKDVEIEPDQMLIKADRLAAQWDGSQFTGEYSVFDSVKIRIERAPLPLDTEGIYAILERVFFKNAAEVETAKRAYLEELARAHAVIDTAYSATDMGVTLPKPVITKDPEFPEKGRKAKHQGTVVLLVMVNERGEAAEVKVVRPAGKGLDEEAIKAVRKWRFIPGRKNGKPVPVKFNVEVDFKLFE